MKKQCMCIDQDVHNQGPRGCVHVMAEALNIRTR